jgi:putative heme-binding domain-containing protein
MIYRKVAKPMRVVLTFALLAGVAVAQHTYTPGDIEDGALLYRGTCVGCHGPDGNNVPGIDLAHMKLKRAANDDQMAAIIRNGVPGTAMPPSNVTEFQAGTIVAYLHSVGNTAGGATSADPARGKAVFEGKGGCMNCHRNRGQGSRFGPDLSDIGAFRRAPEIEKSILDPDAEILPQNRTVRVVTKDGTTTTGRLMNEDTFNVMILDSKDRLVAFPRANLREFTFNDKSPMPSAKGKLSAQEIADVVAYLTSLKNVDVK